MLSKHLLRLLPTGGEVEDINDCGGNDDDDNLPLCHSDLAHDGLAVCQADL